MLVHTYNQKFLGILTLFRTRIDGIFSDEDLFYLRSLGMHFNAVLYNITRKKQQEYPTGASLKELKTQYQLTPRETQILEQLFCFCTNEEIADSLGIRENTLQKHMQNIFRKTNPSSKWDLLRLRGSL